MIVGATFSPPIVLHAFLRHRPPRHFDFRRVTAFARCCRYCHTAFSFAAVFFAAISISYAELFSVTADFLLRRMPFDRLSRCRFDFACLVAAFIFFCHCRALSSCFRRCCAIFIFARYALLARLLLLPKAAFT